MEKPQAYKVIMSRGQGISIDADEVAKVFDGIRRGQPILVRQGLINPSFFINIIEDTERLDNYFDDLHRNRHSYENGIATPPVFKKLKDIFADIKELADKKSINPPAV